MTIQRAPLLGVSGETGVSLDCGTMFGLDGLKTGGLSMIFSENRCPLFGIML